MNHTFSVLAEDFQTRSASISALGVEIFATSIWRSWRTFLLQNHAAVSSTRSKVCYAYCTLLYTIVYYCHYSQFHPAICRCPQLPGRRAASRNAPHRGSDLDRERDRAEDRLFPGDSLFSTRLPMTRPIWTNDDTRPRRRGRQSGRRAGSAASPRCIVIDIDSHRPNETSVMPFRSSVGD